MWALGIAIALAALIALAVAYVDQLVIAADALRRFLLTWEPS